MIMFAIDFHVNSIPDFRDRHRTCSALHSVKFVTSPTEDPILSLFGMFYISMAIVNKLIMVSLGFCKSRHFYEFLN
jgi:hypothetical protein